MRDLLDDINDQDRIWSRKRGLDYELEPDFDSILAKPERRQAKRAHEKKTRKKLDWSNWKENW